VNVALSTYSPSAGESIAVTIGYEGDEEISHVGLRILEIGESDFDSFMATSTPVEPSGEGLRGTLDASDFFKAGKVYEVTALELSSQESTVATLFGGRDYSRTVFRVKGDEDEPEASAAEALDAARKVLEERERRYAEPLGDPDRPGNTEFRVLAFVERVLLTRPLRVPGAQMLPLRSGDDPVGNSSTDEASIINAALADLDWRVRVDPGQWAQRNSRERPVMVMHMPRVYARTREWALEAARYKRDRLLDLLALHRGSSGTPFATVVQPMAATEEERYAGTQFYLETELFSGNLLGGAGTGEDPGVLLRRDKAMGEDPFLALCLSLFREAKGEADLDFAYFRYWNLLEVIAFDRVEGGTRATDFDGEQLWEGKRKATTSRAQGAVHELLKRYMVSRRYLEHHFGQPLPGSLWDAVEVWYACRNAAAHYGRFRAGDPAQQRRPWYRPALKAHEAATARGGYGSHEPYFGNLAAAAETMLQEVLDSETSRTRR
jgi:hypothetical protein